MKSEDQDPLDALRQAWQSEEAPLPPIELARQDETTQTVVRSLQQAWRAEATPPRSGDLGLHAIERKLQANGVLVPARSHLGARGRLVACAAVAMVLFGVWFGAGGASRFSSATLPATPSSDAPLIVADSNTELPEEGSSVAPSPTVTEWSLRADGFEKQAGLVRLVLVEPTRNPDTQSTTNTPYKESLGDPK